MEKVQTCSISNNSGSLMPQTSCQGLIPRLFKTRRGKIARERTKVTPKVIWMLEVYQLLQPEMLSSDSEVMMSVCTSFSLTSALPSRRRAAESSSSSRTQDLMLPPSLRSRDRSAGHLAPRRPIPPKLRRVCLVPEPCAGRSCEVRTDLLAGVTAYERRWSKCWFTVTHARARRLDLRVCCSGNSYEDASRVRRSRCVMRGWRTKVAAPQETCLRPLASPNVRNIQENIREPAAKS